MTKNVWTKCSKSGISELHQVQLFYAHTLYRSLILPKNPQWIPLNPLRSHDNPHNGGHIHRRYTTRRLRTILANSVCSQSVRNKIVQSSLCAKILPFRAFLNSLTIQDGNLQQWMCMGNGRIQSLLPIFPWGKRVGKIVVYLLCVWPP